MDGEEKIYIDTIYYKENGEKITLKTNEKNKYYFENLDNMQEYYFEYPKKYLNEWTDKDGKTHDAILQMQFEVKDDKAKKPGYTTLNLSVQQLFQLD
jgi:hypothetical protein